MFFVIPEMPSKTFVMLLKKLPDHFKVECKKAQPKEVVQAANTAALLGKRVILSNLGVMPALGLPPQVGCCCCYHVTM